MLEVLHVFHFRRHIAKLYGFWVAKLAFNRSIKRRFSPYSKLCLQVPRPNMSSCADVFVSFPWIYIASWLSQLLSCQEREGIALLHHFTFRHNLKGVVFPYRYINFWIHVIKLGLGPYMDCYCRAPAYCYLLCNQKIFWGGGRCAALRRLENSATRKDFHESFDRRIPLS